MTTKNAKIKPLDRKLTERRYNVYITAIFPVEIPVSIAAKEAANGTLDHAIWERFERKFKDKLDFDAICETKFYDSDCTRAWDPIYRLPIACQANHPLNPVDKRRATRAYFSGGAADVFVPVPDSKLPI